MGVGGCGGMVGGCGRYGRRVWGWDVGVGGCGGYKGGMLG